MFKGVIKNIFFDFDGVILDSINCKTQAFEAMYTKYGQEIANQVKRYHLENGGVSRFEKFRHWHKKHLGIEITNEQLNTLSEEFSNLVVDQVISLMRLKDLWILSKATTKNIDSGLLLVRQQLK